MTDDFQTLTRAQVDDAPVKTVVRLVGTWRSEVGIKIDTANGTSMGRWLTTSGMATDFMIAHAGAVLLVPAAAALSKDVPPTLDTGTANTGLRTALTKLADMWGEAHPAADSLRALLAAHPAPQTASDARREDVARAVRDAIDQSYTFEGDLDEDVDRRVTDAVLAVLPAPPVVDEAVEAACAWSDYRKDYGVSSEKHVRVLEHKAFLAGRQSALGTLDAGGVQR